MTDPGMVMEITGGILVIVCVLFMAYYGSRRIGKTFQFRNTGKNIQLIESVPVSQGTYLAMARVGERYYLLGIAAGKIDLLKEMPGISVNVLTARFIGVLSVSKTIYNTSIKVIFIMGFS